MDAVAFPHHRRIQNIIKDLLCTTPDLMVDQLEINDPSRLKFLSDPLWWNGLKYSLREIEVLTNEMQYALLCALRDRNSVCDKMVPKNMFDALQIENQLIIAENEYWIAHASQLRAEISSMVHETEKSLKRAISTVFSKVSRLEHFIQNMYHFPRREGVTCLIGHERFENRSECPIGREAYEDRSDIITNGTFKNLSAIQESMGNMISKDHYQALQNDLHRREMELGRLRTLLGEMVPRDQFNIVIQELDRANRENEDLCRNLTCQDRTRKEEAAANLSEAVALRAKLLPPSHPGDCPGGAAGGNSSCSPSRTGGEQAIQRAAHAAEPREPLPAQPWEEERAGPQLEALASLAADVELKLAQLLLMLPAVVAPSAPTAHHHLYCDLRERHSRDDEAGPAPMRAGPAAASPRGG